MKGIMVAKRRGLVYAPPYGTLKEQEEFYRALTRAKHERARQARIDALTRHRLLQAQKP